MSYETFQTAMHLVSLERYEEALEKLAESFDVEDPWHWWARGTALLELDRIDEAIEAAKSGLSADAEAPELLALLARCRMRQDDLVAAEEAILGALRLDAEDADNLALYALIVAKAGQIDKARKLLARAKAIDPENTRTLRVETALAMASGNDREALLRSRELLRIDPEDAHAHSMAGAVLHDRGDVDDAAPHFRSAVVERPSDHDVAEIARENLYWRNPFMWPLRPLKRFGMGPVWIAGVVLMFAARAAGNEIGAAAVILWVAYCVYSWVVPPLVRRLWRR